MKGGGERWKGEGKGKGGREKKLTDADLKGPTSKGGEEERE